MQTGRAAVWLEASLALKPLESVLTPPVTSTLGRVRALVTGHMTQNPTEYGEALSKMAQQVQVL